MTVDPTPSANGVLCLILPPSPNLYFLFRSGSISRRAGQGRQPREPCPGLSVRIRSALEFRICDRSSGENSSFRLLLAPLFFRPARGGSGNTGVLPLHHNPLPLACL